jgi:predicted nucleic acid-binding protein
VLYTEDEHLLSASTALEIIDPFAGSGERVND